MRIKLLDKRELNGRLGAFCELSKACFSAPISECVVRQRYIDNPYNDLLMCIAEEDDKIVANYSVVPIVLTINGIKYKAALSLNTMTHPDYEGQGLFVKLANCLYGEMLKREYALVCGFPNYLSNRIFCTRLGWKDVYEVPTLELKLTSIKKEMVQNKTDLDKIKLDIWADLETDCSENIHVLKEKKYLQWRYKENPANIYYSVKISKEDWCICHIYNRELNITEYHCGKNIENLKKIIEYLFSFAIYKGLEKITTWCATNTKEHYMFERYGFKNTSPITYFAVRKLAYTGNIDIYDKRNWRIFMGDDNVY